MYDICPAIEDNLIWSSDKKINEPFMIIYDM